MQFRHETALSKMKGMEEEVLTRFQIIKEVSIQHLTLEFLFFLLT